MSSVLVTLGRELSAADTAEAAARIIARVTDTVFEWHAFMLALYDARDDLIRGVLHFDIIAGRRQEAAPKALADRPSKVSRRTIQEGPQLILRPGNSGAFMESEPFGDEERPSASLMFVPIRSGATIVGVLSVQSYVPYTYDHEDLMTLQVLADYCGGALERIAAQVAQRESEARFRMLFEHSPDAIFLVDPHHPSGAWPIVDCNAAACQMNGYAHHELVGRSLDFLRLAQTNAASDAMYLAELKQGHTLHFETENCRKDQTAFPIECSASYIRVGGRDLVLEIDRDVSERRMVEDRLRLRGEISAALTESLEYQSILQRVAELLIPAFADWCAIDMTQPDGTLERVAVANQASSNSAVSSGTVQDYGEHPFLVHATAQVLRSSTPRYFPTMRDRSLEAGADPAGADSLPRMGLRSAMVVPLVARDRTLGAISLVTAKSARTFVAADLAFMQDLATRTALAVDNARLYRESQNAIRARDELLSIAAHELRTPLTALFGYAQILHEHSKSAPPLRPADRKAIQIMFNQAERLNRLINTLLDLSRIATGHFSLNREPLDLVELVRLVAGEVVPLLEQHTLAVDVVPGAGTLIVDGDAQRLEQVFLNLLQNAVKYSPGGGTILLRVETDGSQAQVTVTDPGIGIPAAALPRLFDRFYRASNTEANFVKGMGIGLYIVREIVTRHGGTVDVTSEEWNGSTFIVQLPLMHGAEE